MTQKELLYVEDAVEHEENILKIIDNLKNNMESDELLSFIDEQKKTHQDIYNSLMDLLKEKAHEW